MDEVDNSLEFTREIEIETSRVDLKLVQYSVGDVSCVVWDAGIVLGKYLDNLQSQSNTLGGRIVIDIGAGTGVAGLFAAALGATVILTDLPEVIPLLEKNIELNKDILHGNASASVLIWGQYKNTLPVPDFILVSDCVYYDQSAEKLIPTLVELSTFNTEVLISYEDRTFNSTKQVLKKFLEGLKKSFHVEVIPPSLQHPNFQSDDIHLLKCKKLKENEH